ncbi:hypothetical protein LMG29660_02210 [Burkholderia puraquae]|uniref:Uncharacterized protein n=1 Tax=Burkholderia puraquae TaxID=1904757 RepID=A0A6J5DI15_9BURK|nr:hypothetical protein LMG29660_02210 [Burkholderia puraquae]
MESAREALREFPLAKAGLIERDIIPLGALLGWEALFAGATRDVHGRRRDANTPRGPGAGEIRHNGRRLRHP